MELEQGRQHEFGGKARFLAALVSLAAWTGLVVQFGATFDTQGSVPETLWILLRFFTVLTNLMVAIVFGAIALGSRRFSSPSHIGCAVLSIILVGVVYGILLRGLMDLSGGAVLANILLHQATPVIAPLWWLAFGRRGWLTRRDPWLWMLWPLAYLAYALTRGSIEEKFAYPFLDYVHKGWSTVLAHGLVMALGFILLGHVMLWTDRRR